MSKERVTKFKCIICRRNFERPRRKGEPKFDTRLRSICSPRCKKKYDEERKRW